MITLKNTVIYFIVGTIKSMFVPIILFVFSVCKSGTIMLKFYPLKALLLFVLLCSTVAGLHAQSMTLTKSVINFTTGGDGSLASDGDILIYTITVKNTSSSNFTSSKLYDNIPAGVTYVTGSTTLNGSAVSDVSGKMPYANGGLFNTSSNGSGILGVNKTATIVFKVEVTANAGSIKNTATVDAVYNSNTSFVKTSNTVFTNLIEDELCSAIFQSTGATPTSNVYTKLRDVDPATGQATTLYYDGSTGPCYNAITKAALTSGSLYATPAAIAYDKDSNRIYFVNQGTGSPNLGYIDLNFSTPRAYSFVGYPLETATCGGCGINRMGFASDGKGYALTSDASDLIQFYINSSNVPVITRLGPLINDASNGSKNILTEQGGDVFGDGSGKLYLIAHSGAMYKINPSTRNAVYLGTTSPSPGDSYSLAIDGSGGVYVGGGYQKVLKVDLNTMALTQISSGTTNVYWAGDYTSCAFPVLSPSITASKTFVNVNGSSTVVGGDTVKYIITIKNSGNLNAASVHLYDYIPSSTHYLAGSTTLNGTTVADVSGVMPFAVSGGAYVKTAGEQNGILKPGDANAAVVTFEVVTEPLKTVCNQSKITLLDDDGNTIFVNSSDPDSVDQTPTCFVTDQLLILNDLKFKGSLNNGQSVLNWSMTGDENVAYYEIEYSETGSSFTSLAKVPGRGNTGVLNSYRYTDVTNNLSAIRYYRIKIVQPGGSSSYSGIIRLDVKGMNIQVMPNPFDKSLNLQLQLKTGQPVQIRLLDLSGRAVYTTSEQLGAGNHSLSINLPAGVAKGMYVLDVSTGNTLLYHKKLLKQ
jgi:uncharacterized repeat protein (TIGR01451 family)